MARILFATFGSYGDLYPYLAIGRQMRARGFDVTIATSASYRAKTEEAGLDFALVRPDISLDNTELLNYIFDARRGTERVLRLVSSVVRESYDDTFAAARHADLIVTHPITFAAVLVARKLGMPWVSTVLAPISFLSAIDPPVLAPAPWLRHLKALGPGPLRAIHAIGRRSALPWIRPVLELAGELGLRDIGNPVFEGSYAPARVLALFSKTLATPQPDWPPQTVLTGFPFYDGPAELAPELERFLRQGDAPIVFTLGSSAVGAAGRFYRESLDCVQRMGIRAVFLTGSHPQGLPEDLPGNVLAWHYAPHAHLFPRASAIVHQGGVGTTAQAMRSGHPMLVVPFSHDQFDNGHRIQRLGAGEVLYRSEYKSRRVETTLQQLLHDRAYRSAAARIAAAIATENGAASAADALAKATIEPECAR